MGGEQGRTPAGAGAASDTGRWPRASCSMRASCRTPASSGWRARVPGQQGSGAGWPLVSRRTALPCPARHPRRPSPSMLPRRLPHKGGAWQPHLRTSGSKGDHPSHALLAGAAEVKLRAAPEQAAAHERLPPVPVDAAHGQPARTSNAGPDWSEQAHNQRDSGGAAAAPSPARRGRGGHPLAGALETATRVGSHLHLRCQCYQSALEPGRLQNPPPSRPLLTSA